MTCNISADNFSEESGVASPNEHLAKDTFTISIISNTIRPKRQNAIKLINVQETVVTDSHLMYQTFPQKTRDAEIVFTIVVPPQYGQLLLSSSSGHDSTFSTPQKLRTDSTFTQVKFEFCLVVMHTILPIKLCRSFKANHCRTYAQIVITHSFHRYQL